MERGRLARIQTSRWEQSRPLGVWWSEWDWVHLTSRSSPIPLLNEVAQGCWKRIEIEGRRHPQPHHPITELRLAIECSQNVLPFVNGNVTKSRSKREEVLRGTTRSVAVR